MKERVHDSFPKQFDPFTSAGRYFNYTHSLYIRRNLDNSGKFALVNNRDSYRMAKERENHTVFNIKGAGPVQKENNKICLRNPFKGNQHPFPFNNIIGMPHPGSINNPDRKPPDINYFFYDIPGRAWNGGHYGPFFLEQGIEKARFADIRLPGNQNRDPIFQGLAFIVPGKE